MKVLFSLFLTGILLLLLSCSDNSANEPQAGSITGIVIDSKDQQPIESAVITTEPPTNSILTNAEGKFEIKDIQTGEYSVTASKTNYLSQTIKVTVNAGKTANASFVLTDTTKKDLGAIKGKVVNSVTLEPVKGASISTIPRTTNILTDDNGEFTFDEIAAGEYTIRVEKTDYNIKEVVVMVSPGKLTNVTINLTDKQTTNKPPEKPIIISPFDGETISDSIVTFSWECSDPDGDELTYDILLSQNNPPSDYIAKNIDKKQFSFELPENDKTYYWKVIAKDIYDDISESDVYSITYKKGSIPSGGLILYYPFDDETAEDKSNHNNDGVLMNDYTFVNGKIGKAVRLKGTDDLLGNGSYITLPYIDFKSLTDFTISLWVYEESLQYFAGEAYINWGNASTGWVGISNFVKPPENSDLVVNFSVGCEAANNYARQEPVWVPFNTNNRMKWVHYALVYRNGVTTGYINGQKVGSKLHTIDKLEKIGAIGKHWWNYGGTNSATSMTFRVDEVRVYDRALSDEEIENLAK